MNDECWLEMDIYWFQGSLLEQKVAELFDRLTPLWQREPAARKGLAMCAGWLLDSVLYWNGKLDDVIRCCQPPLYEEWTYGRLKSLLDCLKSEARKRNIHNFHTVLMVMGVPDQVLDEENTCGGWLGRTDSRSDRHHYSIRGNWFPEHPEITDTQFGAFDFGLAVNVPSNEEVCRRPNPVFGDYFADKLCDLAAHIGLDGLVFRDRIFTPAYVRGSRRRYRGPEETDYWTGTWIRLFQEIKLQQPAFLVIGYDSGTSSMEEWRSHGFDLERTALSGCLDLWISQTWASAWQDYWPMHSMGYTFQLTNVLVDMAMLAHTPCKHLILIETFDAWEPWDTIHEFPSKLAWEIWAYSHASVLKPGGEVKRSDGCYISWMNHGFELLPETSVSYLRTTMERSAADLARQPVPGGPSLVYHRAGLEALLRQPAEYSRGEEMDDWTALLLKYGMPVLSITRSEWLADIEADAFLFPAPASIDDKLSSALLTKLNEGTPVLFTGQAGLLPKPLRSALGIAIAERPTHAELPSAGLVEQPLSAKVGTAGLVLNQRYRTLAESADWDSLIRALDGPIFAKHRTLPCWIWETPEWGTLREMHLTHLSIQSPQTYQAVAFAIGEQGFGPERIGWGNRDWQKPIAFLFWRYPEEGEIGVLVGNLETGVVGSSQFGVEGELRCYRPDTWTCAASKPFSPGILELGQASWRVALAGHKAGYFSMARH
ncbi:hypothetical protein [Cohnella hashimotonis]|uniref:Glycosyl hydrolase-like 10 domain-containing protein n=1 Tax=Cohnella hashimotonis TaxID=2826895 RepID=A0ABT6TAN2_9BACL|nr:hypothetical protein [Cohnella hashimotonis]MDI4643700.1 hypothetical protein [Cohnella hashimotonis]